jgi:uncharacterized low-complexity protein
MSILNKKPLAAAFGAAFLVTAIAPLASAEANPFAANQLSSGYDLANYGGHEGKCGEGKCGESDEKATKEGKCGEGKCGEKAEKAEKGEKAKEGKCGEGKCGGHS